MATRTAPAGQRRFGTFSGVFTPSILTIFGVILFLRTGFVVGNAGLWRGLLIILMAEAVVILTSLSISAIATNADVKIGGAYFLISRSLGTEFGGAIGIVLYLSQAVSVSFYVIGFVEAFQSAFPGFPLDTRLLSSIVCLLLFIVTFIGAESAIKAQFFILAALVVSILSFLAGGTLGFNPETLRANLGPGYIPGMSLWPVFAIFFPAVTGILAGVNMSGDLRDPRRNLPRGVLLAVGTSTVVYLVTAVLLAGNFPRALLVGDSSVMRLRSIIPSTIVVGVFAATLSSALGSFLGAPRVLQALSSDRIFSLLRPFAKGSGPANEPRRGTILTFVIAEAAVLIGDLNAIAPVITMFFMITYGMLNFATFYETAAGNPSFRPRFKAFHWSTALMGTAGCGAIMILIDPLAAGISLIILLVLYKSVERRALTATWGDARAGFLFSRTRQSLLRLDRRPLHAKNWRPRILVLSGNPHRRLELVDWARRLEAGKGLIVLGNVVSGSFPEAIGEKRKQEAILRRFIEEHHLEAFQEVVAAPDFETGVAALVQAAGIGQLKPNTVFFGASGHSDRYALFGNILRMTHNLGMNIVLARPAGESSSPGGTVDVWWRGKENGALMALFAHLIRRDPEGRPGRIRILRLLRKEAEAGNALAGLEELIRRSRIEARPEIVVSTAPFFQVLKERSGAAEAVFLGLNIPRSDQDAEFFSDLSAALEGLPNAFLVKSVLDENLILT